MLGGEPLESQLVLGQGSRVSLGMVLLLTNWEQNLQEALVEE